MREMFCFQCQQTAHNTGCDGKAGVCGKKADTANYQDELIGALIGLARAARAGTPTPHTDELILKGLFTTITNVNFNNILVVYYQQGRRIKNYCSVKVVTNIFHPIRLLVFSDSYFLLLFYPSLVW